MPEKVKITIIIEAENAPQKEVNVMHDINRTLMSTLLEAGVVSGDFCAGRGVCRRCRLRFMDAAPIPTAIERSAFNPDELRQGYRLACVAKPRNGCVVRLEFIKGREINVVTAAPELIMDTENPRKVADAACISADIDRDSQPELVRNTEHSSQSNPSHNIGLTDRREHSLEIDLNGRRNYIIAVDLGTTTIAMQLMEMETGRAVDTYCAMNPQRSYGVDVLSRIQAANSGYAKAMREGVWKVIYDGVDKFRQIKTAVQPIEICCMCIAGNTAMAHLLMGLSTEGLGKSPFTPVELGLQKCVIDKYAIPVYITPGISAFVGGDIVAGLYHCNLLGSFISEPDCEACQHTGEDTMRSPLISEPSGATLFIDLGTNGEMAIVGGNRIIVTAAAAGPAFEGGGSAAVPGSDMVKLTAALLEQGIIDETGLLAEAYFDEGVNVTISSDFAFSISGANSDALSTSGGGFALTQKDIRALQMAKAAVRAGIDILCEKIAPLKVSKVYLAGGFGYYLDVNAAAAIGLLPESLRDCTQAAGNTSLVGASDMGRDLWLGRLEEDELAGRLNRIESINLANEEDFERLYLSYLNFL